jgi:hypothetical protein
MTEQHECEALKAEFAIFRANILGMLPQPSNPAVSNHWILDAISHVIRERQALLRVARAAAAGLASWRGSVEAAYWEGYDTGDDKVLLVSLVEALKEVEHLLD